MNEGNELPKNNDTPPEYRPFAGIPDAEPQPSASGQPRQSEITAPGNQPQNPEEENADLLYGGFGEHHVDVRGVSVSGGLPGVLANTLRSDWKTTRRPDGLIEVRRTFTGVVGGAGHCRRGFCSRE